MAGGAEPSRARAQRRVSGTGMQSGLQSRAGILHAAPLRMMSIPALPCSPAAVGTVGMQNSRSVPLEAQSPDGSE